jgi:hypothetical protein
MQRRAGPRSDHGLADSPFRSRFPRCHLNHVVLVLVPVTLASSSSLILAVGLVILALRPLPHGAAVFVPLSSSSSSPLPSALVIVPAATVSPSLPSSSLSSPPRHFRHGPLVSLTIALTAAVSTSPTSLALCPPYDGTGSPRPAGVASRTVGSDCLLFASTPRLLTLTKPKYVRLVPPFPRVPKESPDSSC